MHQQTPEPTDGAPEVRLARAFEASSRIEGWADGARALSLLSAVSESGWLTLLAEPCDAAFLEAATGLAGDRVDDVLAALEAHGVVVRDGAQARLSEEFAALGADDAWVGVRDTLAMANLTVAAVARSTRPGTDGPPDAAEAMVVARALGGRTTPVAHVVYDGVFAHIPEDHEALRQGGDRLLEVGSGVATTALTRAQADPALQVVAIEIVPEVAVESQRRAEALGVADRFTSVVADAQDFEATAEFDVAFWAQPFFHGSARRGTLAMMLRALKPGGLLVMQELYPAPTDEAERRRSSMMRLVYERWGVSFGPSAEDLSAEGSAAGFELVRLAPTPPLGRSVLMRRPQDPGV